MILPTLVQWSEELEGKVEIVKFNCNKYNKELGVALGIKVGAAGRRWASLWVLGGGAGH